MSRSVHRLVVSLSCDPNPHGHGGQRRSQQILELVGEAQSELVIAPIGINLDRGILGKWFRYWRGWDRNRKLFGSPRWGSDNSLCGAHELPLIEGAAGVWIVEDTRWPHAISEAQRLSWRVIAVPQNLESLARARERGFSAGKSARMLADEIAALSLADAVFCISREEQHLLRCAGIQAQYLPYQPPKKSIPLLASVRTSRLNTSKDFLLMVVNVHNYANKRGVISFLSSLTRDVVLKMPPIVLAGFGIGEFAEKLDPDKVRVVGELNDAMLMDYQSRAIAMLVHQDYGTGCLTKIRDYQQAGIPVLANETAARSYWGCPGLHVYHHVNEIPAILAQGVDEPVAWIDYKLYLSKFEQKLNDLLRF